MNPTHFMLAGLVAAYLLGGLAVPAGLPLGLAMFSIAVPVTLREAGWSRDHDELQRLGQRRGALWAFVLLLGMAPLDPHLTGAVREEFAARSLEAAISLFAFIALATARGAPAATRLLLSVGALLALAYGASRLPDWDKLAAMAVVGLVMAAVGWLAGRAPRLAAAVIGGVWVLRLVPAVRGGAPEVWVYLPTAVFIAALAVLLARTVPDAVAAPAA